MNVTVNLDETGDIMSLSFDTEELHKDDAELAKTLRAFVIDKVKANVMLEGKTK